MATLSDRHILTSIFNPFLPLGQSVKDVEELNLKDSTEDTDDDTAEAKMATDMELMGVNYAEQGDINKSLELFNKAIETAPERASGYNNRAQALRLTGDVAGAERDLERAIKVSGGRGHVASQAYCQRGVILQLRGDKQSAIENYETAAKLGNEFAQTMAVQLNPYAALCNQMLSQVMAKLHNGKPLD